MVFGNRIRDVNAMRIVEQLIYGCLYLRVQIPAVQVGRLDAIPVLSQLARGERHSGPKLKSFGSCERAAGNVLVAGDLSVLDQCLRTFLDLEDDIDLRLAIDGVRSNLHFLVSPVVIDRLDVLFALLHQFVADRAVGPNVRLLDVHLIEQILLGNGIVAVKENPIDLVLSATIDVVNDKNFVGLPLEFGGDSHIGKALLLKVIDQISLPFLHQITINRALGINWDELPHLATAKKRNRTQARSSGAYGDDRSDFNLE